MSELEDEARAIFSLSGPLFFTHQGIHFRDVRTLRDGDAVTCSLTPYLCRSNQLPYNPTGSPLTLSDMPIPTTPSAALGLLSPSGFLAGYQECRFPITPHLDSEVQDARLEGHAETSSDGSADSFLGSDSDNNVQNPSKVTRRRKRDADSSHELTFISLLDEFMNDPAMQVVSTATQAKYRQHIATILTLANGMGFNADDAVTRGNIWYEDMVLSSVHPKRLRAASASTPNSIDRDVALGKAQASTAAAQRAAISNFAIFCARKRAST